ncbi:putative nuclease HARBI1 isoform X2 [Odontomachus brunneus]|nr:putative nuclease HARBI1 isoform X2 [Odontomachus brunneus]
MVAETRGETVFNEKIDNYVERVVPGYSRTIFKEHSRMFPETFEIVLTIIGPGLHAINVSSGRKSISEKKQLLIAIWFMATPDSYRSIATKFGVGKATAFRALRRVTYALHCVAPQFIIWPKDQVAVNVIEQFEKSCGFPNVIGAIDGTHIKIRAPSVDANSYINRKGFHSINVQVVCDSFGRFTHVYAGQVGSVHDSRVFRNSSIARFVEFPEEYFPSNSHIIGDAAYGIHPHVMVPFRDNGHLTDRQKNFNYCLSSTRMAVERTIGSLKIRFRILLDCLPLTNTKKVPEFILACCVLYNICLIQNDEMPIGVQLRLNDDVGPAYADGNAIELGKEKRITIMNALPMKI